MIPVNSNSNDQTKKVRFMPKLKNCGSSHSIKSVNPLNRSYDLTHDYSKSMQQLDNLQTNSETFSSYNPIGSGLKNNSSMSDFRRNLHKLYPDHNNPKNDYEQTHSNQVQYLMRRKTNKNQQPRQFQQNMNRSYDGYKGSNATQPIYTYSRPNL